jgi:acetolactate synthase-1/2/3 large subunit
MFPNLPGTAKIIQCTIDDRDLNKDYPATCMVMGDAGLTLREFERQARARIDWGKGLPASDPTAEIADRRRVWLDRWVPKLESDEVPLNPYRIIHELYGAIDPANTIITHDSGGPRDQLAPFWTTTAPLTYLGWGHSTQLGYSLALALGAKLANPDRLVINVLGDTAFGMCAVDLETAARNRIGLLTILLNNSAMGNYEKHMPLAVEKFGAKGLTGDYVQVATGLGAHAERVTTPDAIAPAIRRAIEQTQQGKPAVVEFITREEPALSLYA